MGNTQTIILRTIVLLLCFPAVLVLLQGLLAPLLLLVTDAPEPSTYLMTAAVLLGWIGVFGLVRTAFGVGSTYSPGRMFVTTTFSSGAVSLGLALYLFSFSVLISVYAGVVLLTSIWVVCGWRKTIANKSLKNDTEKRAF